MSDNTNTNVQTPTYDNVTCSAVGYQSVGVCVPVTVTPFAHAEPTKTTCCGVPIVTPGETVCSGKKNDVCTFTISQSICVEVPVSFGASAKVGDTYVDCLGASAEDICTDCTGDGRAEV